MKNRKIKLALGILCAVVVLLCGIYSVIYAIANPELTRTQLSLKLWWLAPIFFGGMFGAKQALLEL